MRRPAMIGERTRDRFDVSLPTWRRATLGAKLGGVIFLCMVVGMVVAACFFFRQAQTEADAKARSLADEATVNIVARVRAEFEQSFQIVSTTRDSLVALWSSDVRDRRVGDILLKQMLEADSDRFGAWTAWKPNAFDNKDKDFVNAPSSDKTGRYLSYWHQNGMEIALDKVRGYDDKAADLYQTPMETSTAYLSEPYFIRSNDRRIAMVSYSEPIIGEDKLVGAIGIDVALSPLVDSIAAIPLPKGAGVTLVSHGGIIVAAENPSLLDVPLAQGRPDLASDFAAVQVANQADRRIDTPSGPLVRSWHPISFSTVKTPWYVLSEIPIGAFASDATRQQMPTFFVVLGIVASMMVAILFAVRRLVTGPLERVNGFIEGLRDDDGPRDCPGLQRGDEIGSIAKTPAAFKTSEQEVDRLKAAERVREARFADERRIELRQLANHLAASVQSVAKLVDATSRKIMRRAEAMTAAAIASADKTKEIADASQAADASVCAVDGAAISLREAIDRITAEMQLARRVASDAADHAKASGTVTVELSMRASRIGEIVAMISAIAQRTNMLALNATIEAARAGEAGRGFAVVAQEVKALASQTTAATTDIGNQIQAMQTTATQAANALSAIGGSVAEIDAISTSIAGAVLLQGDATSQIGQSVGTAVAASRKVSAAIGEVDRAATVTGDAAAHMLIDISQLTDEIERLDDEVLDVIAKIRAA